MKISQHQNLQIMDAMTINSISLEVSCIQAAMQHPAFAENHVSFYPSISYTPYKIFMSSPTNFAYSSFIFKIAV